AVARAGDEDAGEGALRPRLPDPLERDVAVEEGAVGGERERVVALGAAVGVGVRLRLPAEAAVQRDVGRVERARLARATALRGAGDDVLEVRGVDRHR